jgi:hypothetical protein
MFDRTRFTSGEQFSPHSLPRGSYKSSWFLAAPTRECPLCFINHTQVPAPQSLLREANGIGALPLRQGVHLGL